MKTLQQVLIVAATSLFVLSFILAPSILGGFSAAFFIAVTILEFTDFDEETDA